MLSALLADTPLGPMTVVLGNDGVLATFATEDPSDIEAFARSLGTSVGGAADGADNVRRELDAYFGGRLHRFETRVDLSVVGDGFTRRALEATRSVPYGEMRTYGDIAGAAGNPRAARAAGGALARCPIELFVPCHRVVRAGPSLGSYGSQNERRHFLLRLEGAIA